VGNKKEKFVKRRASKEITGIPVGIKHTWEKRQGRVLCKEKWHYFQNMKNAAKPNPVTDIQSTTECSKAKPCHGYTEHYWMQQSQTLSRIYSAPLNVCLLFEIPVTCFTFIYWQVLNT
jgi:hypothetical protein